MEVLGARAWTSKRLRPSGQSSRRVWTAAALPAHLRTEASVTLLRAPDQICKELEAAERRFVALFEAWQAEVKGRHAGGGLTEKLADRAEELLRHQRGLADRMLILWAELAQSQGLHAPD